MRTHQYTPTLTYTYTHINLCSQHTTYKYTHTRAYTHIQYARANFQPSVAEEVVELLIPDTVELCKMLEEAHSLKTFAEKDSLQQVHARLDWSRIGPELVQL